MSARGGAIVRALAPATLVAGLLFGAPAGARAQEPASASPPTGTASRLAHVEAESAVLALEVAELRERIERLEAALGTGATASVATDTARLAADGKSIVVPGVVPPRGELDATRRRVEADINAFVDGIKVYRMDTGRFPGTLEDLISGSADGWDGPYVRGGLQGLLDPWRRPYLYARVSGDPPVDIGTYGKDGAPGGEGANADIFPLRPTARRSR